MNRKQLVSISIAAGTALVLASMQLAAHPAAREQQGWASWYGSGFAGRPTASGERFSPQALTAAHRSLPLGTRALVTNLETGQQVEVKINDRGPFTDHGRRVIDLSRAAAKRIGLVRRGVGPVRVTVMDAARPRQGMATRVARASVHPVGEEKSQGLARPAPGTWSVVSHIAAPGAGERAPTAAFPPLDCRVTPEICLAGS